MAQIVAKFVSRSLCSISMLENRKLSKFIPLLHINRLPYMSTNKKWGQGLFDGGHGLLHQNACDDALQEDCFNTIDYIVL